MYLITRGDWDGLVCAVLLSAVENVERIEFAHPKAMQDGNVPVRPDAIIANLPYHPNCALWFDHHISEEEKAQHIGAFKGKFGLAPSAARLIYEYYADPRLDRYLPLLEAADQYDSAQLKMRDVLIPEGYIQIAFTIDPRTSLSDVDYPQYFLHVWKRLQNATLEQVLADPVVAQMVERVKRDDLAFEEILFAHTRVEGNLAITDFRGLDKIPTGNRFLVHAHYPETNVAARIFTGKEGRVVLALGHSIFKRDCRTNVGELLARYGGGGHRGAGTAQFRPEEAGAKIQEILETVKANG
ncbi:MAG: exopolyphosphatase [Anaerolineales bacterium]